MYCDTVIITVWILNMAQFKDDASLAVFCRSFSLQRLLWERIPACSHSVFAPTVSITRSVTCFCSSVKSCQTWRIVFVNEWTVSGSISNGAQLVLFQSLKKLHWILFLQICSEKSATLQNWLTDMRLIFFLLNVPKKKADRCNAPLNANISKLCSCYTHFFKLLSVLCMCVCVFVCFLSCSAGCLWRCTTWLTMSSSPWSHTSTLTVEQTALCHTACSPPAPDRRMDGGRTHGGIYKQTLSLNSLACSVF